MIIALAIFCLLAAVLPALMFAKNVGLYASLPPARGGADLEPISVLIPARNEEANLPAALESIVQNIGVDFEIVVLDDHSSDRTAGLVRDFALRHPQVRLVAGHALPAGACGKPFACQQLAAAARYPLLLFMDADVRLSRPDTLARVAQFMEERPVALASGVPRQETGALGEKLIIPLIHFVLLGFLPLERMRDETDPRLSAGCGQLFVARRAAYEVSGGHGAIRARIHDGLALPRLFRTHGFATDLFDATDAFTCRMYHSFADLWAGFAKNAHEGLATRHLIGPVTFFLLAGQVAPFLLLAFAREPFVLLVSAAACLAALLPRLCAVARFQQPWLGALLHPVAIALLLAIQWFAFVRTRLRRPAAWKGRSYAQAE